MLHHMSVVLRAAGLAFQEAVAVGPYFGGNTLGTESNPLPKQFSDLLPAKRRRKIFIAADCGLDEFLFAVLENQYLFLHRVSRD